MIMLTVVFAVVSLLLNQPGRTNCTLEAVVMTVARDVEHYEHSKNRMPGQN